MKGDFKVFLRWGMGFRNNLFCLVCLGLDIWINEIVYFSCVYYEVLFINMIYCNRGFCCGFCICEDDFLW